MVAIAQKIQVVLITMILVGGAWYLYTNRENISIMHWFLPETPIMHIGDIPLRIEVADSLEERVKGLSGRKELEYINGVLFIFPEADYHGMWMKDMNFPIDIIWISEDLTVVSIDKNVLPETYPRVFRPAKPARYAVETNVYFSDSLGITTGKKVRIPEKYLPKE